MTKKDIPSKIILGLKNINIFIGFKFRGIIILVFIFIILSINLKHVFLPLIREMNYIATRLIFYPDFSYEEKMKEKVGVEYYDWTKLVREHTNTDSKVIHPPQMWPWPQSGNPEFSQYFLYPAKLIREDRKRIIEKGDISHVLIAWGEGVVENRLYGWPKFPVFARKIYYLPQTRRVEVDGLEDLKPWERNADRVITYADGQFFNLIYTSSIYDYWIKDVNETLSPSKKLGIKVKSNRVNSTTLVARIAFDKEKDAIFSSPANQKIDEWETLVLNDLYQRAYKFGSLQGWPVGRMRVSGVGIDTGHPAMMPYLEKWGLIEVEKGGEDHFEFLNNQTVNSQTLLSLANIYSLDGNEDEAFRFYRQVAVLEPSNPWAYYGLAETANKMGNTGLAEEEYKKAIELAPEISWFPFALGELYRKGGSFNKADAVYQESLSLYPESFWTYLSLGEVYEVLGKLELSYKYYRLASDGPRRYFSSDGKIAWEKAKKIDDEQNKIIEESLNRINKDPEDWEARIVLGKNYFVLGQIAKAKEQYEVVYKNAPEKWAEIPLVSPLIVDQLSQPLYGINGEAVDTVLIEDKRVVLLDNYHSYIKYPREFLPIENGTIEISWRPPDDFSENSLPRNLLYQFDGLHLWVAENELYFAIFEKQEKIWKIISTPFKLEAKRWYQIGVNYGKEGMNLSLNGEKMSHGAFSGGINKKNDLFLGRGPLWFISDMILSSGYFKEIKIYDYQKLVED